MTSSSDLPDETFSEARERWDLDRLYRDLAAVNQPQRLTPSEKEYLRALLLGLGPSEIATILHRSANGVGVALSHLYQLVNQLLNLPPRTVRAMNVRYFLEQAGYLRAREQDVSDNVADLEWYVDRPPVESNCYSTILQPGSLIRIKAPQQMGKTLLLSKILKQVEQKQYRTVKLNFQELDKDNFENLDKFLKVFCRYVSHYLGLPDRVTDLWTQTFGSKINCRVYFEEYLLPALDSPLVLGLDDVDLVFHYEDIAADFLSLLRVWYEEGQNRGIWQKFRLILVHSTEVYVPLDSNQSPFNVGFPVNLREFRPEEVWNLAKACQFNWQVAQIEQLTQLVGGHPYLVRLMLNAMVQQELTLDQVIELAPTESGPFATHLRRHLLCLNKHPELAKAMTKVVAASEPIHLNTVQAFQLHSMGLVRLEGNRVRIRNGLYQQYFSDRLIQENAGDE
jgi:DNA-binding CsgD family transcriptional regulator